MAETLATARKENKASDGEEQFQDVLDTALTEMESEGVDLAAPSDAGAPPVVEAEPIVAAAEPEPIAEPDFEDAAKAIVPMVTEAAPVAPVVDPLDNTAPLDYGQGRVFDGVLIDKTNGGAFILPDKLDAVRARLNEADTFRGQAEQLAQKVQHYDGLTYKTTGIDGDPAQEFTGVDAFVRAQADAAALAAGTLVLMAQIEVSFPGEEFAKARQELYDKMQFEVRRTAFNTGNAIRERLQTQQQQVVSQATQGQQETASFDRAIAQISTALPALTPKDMEEGKQFFAKRPQLLYRNANGQDAQQYGVKVGERIFDPTAMNEWYSGRAALRAETKTAESARVTAASAATKHNAAMDKGRQPVTTGRRAPVAATPAERSVPITEKSQRKKALTDLLDTSLQELGIEG